MKREHITRDNNGWFLVRLKCSLNEEERSIKKLAETFEYWAFYNGEKWDVDDIFDFYIVDVLKAEAKDADKH